MRATFLVSFYLVFFHLIIIFFTAKVQARTLIACGHPYYPPVSWVKDQEVIGVAPALVKLIFGELGYQVKLTMIGNWKRCLSEVKNGHADIVVAAYRIASREQSFDFSDQPIVADPIGVFINREQGNHYNSLDDLKGKTVGLLFGDSFGDSVDAFIADNNQIEYVSKGKQNFEKFAYGRIDFMLLGLGTGQLQTQKFGYSDNIIAAPIKLETQYYYLALSQESKLRQHLPYINARLKTLNQQGNIKALLSHYSHLYLNTSNEVSGLNP